MTVSLTSLVQTMKPKEGVVRRKIAKAIDLLEQAKNALNGFVPDADVAIDDALERLYAAGEETEE